MSNITISSLYNSYFQSVWDNAESSYKKGILSLVEHNPRGKMVDLGCDDGIWTMELSKKMGVKKGNIFGVDLIEVRYRNAVKKGILVKKSDLNKKLPFSSGTFDFVHANQTIEHLWSLDNFATEIKRILKKDGYAIVCTENLSSWHNIIASLLGFQPFSLTNVTAKGSLGNPFALHSVEGPDFTTWQHTRVLSYFGLKDIFEKHGFTVEKYFGFGYHPFPFPLANILSFIDPIHAAFPVIKIRKASVV